MKEFKYPFRVGKKKGIAVLDATGVEIVIFPKGQELMAKKMCELFNNESLKKEILHNVDSNKIKTIKDMIHVPTGITGCFIKEIKPTGKPLTTHIETVKGLFFAPSHEFIEINLNEYRPRTLTHRG